MERIVAIGGVIALALVTLACQPATKEDIEALKAQQNQILEKLAELEERIPSRPARRQPPAEDYDKVHEIPVDDAPLLGNPDAPITVVEFSDFQCPYCASTAPAVKALYDKYPDKVRVVYKHFPLNFHAAAKPAAIASLAAQDQGKFWEFHDIVFEATKQNTLEASDQAMVEYAKQAGLDVERFKRDLEQKRDQYERRVNQDYLEGQRANVRGTPTLYINGKKVRNRSVLGMSQMVDSLLAELENKAS